MENDYLVEIATFAYVNDSYILQSMLQNEGIDFFMRNEHVTSYLPALGKASGVILTVRSSDVEAALLVIKEGGYEKFLNADFSQE